MVSKPSSDETKYLENTLEQGFETFHLYDIPFTLPNTPNREGGQDGDAPSPPGGYRLYKSRFGGLVALVSFLSELFVWFLVLNCLLYQVILGIVAGMSGPWFGPIANKGKSIWHNVLLINL